MDYKSMIDKSIKSKNSRRLKIILLFCVICGIIVGIILIINIYKTPPSKPTPPTIPTTPTTPTTPTPTTPTPTTPTPTTASPPTPTTSTPNISIPPTTSPQLNTSSSITSSSSSSSWISSTPIPNTTSSSVLITLNSQITNLIILLQVLQQNLFKFYTTVNDIDLKFDKYRRKPPSSTNKYDQYRYYIIDNLDNNATYITQMEQNIITINNCIKIIQNNPKIPKPLSDLLNKIIGLNKTIIDNNTIIISDIKKYVGIQPVGSVIYRDISTITDKFISQLHNKAVIYHSLQGNNDININNLIAQQPNTSNTKNSQSSSTQTDNIQ